MCKVYTGYCGASEKEHGLCACTVDYLSVQAHKPCSISHLNGEVVRHGLVSYFQFGPEFSIWCPEYKVQINNSISVN